MDCFPSCHTSQQLSGTPGGRAVTEEREGEEGLPAEGTSGYAGVHETLTQCCCSIGPMS